MTVLITGGAGFIGSNFILDWLVEGDASFPNLYKKFFEEFIIKPVTFVLGTQSRTGEIFLHGMHYKLQLQKSFRSILSVMVAPDGTLTEAEMFV